MREIDEADSRVVDPDAYIREHRETLVDIIKHGNDDFVRALALAALVEFGDEAECERVKRDLERAFQSETSA